MPVDITKFNDQVATFNQKYKLNFSLENYEQELAKQYRKIKPKDEDAVLAVQTEVFYTTIKGLYRDVAENAVRLGEADKNLFSLDMMDEFDDIVQGYHQADNNQGGVLSEPYGGKEKLYRLEAIQDAVKSVPKSKAEIFAIEYKNGGKPIREMRDFANTLSAHEADNDKALMALQYAEALRLANESRSFWWRFFHPIRNRAEQREAVNIRGQVFDVLGTARWNKVDGIFDNEWYNDRVTGMQSKPLSEAISTVNFAIAEIHHDNNSKEQARKVELEGEKIIEVPEGKYLADKKLFEIGYRPNLENINQELKEFEKLNKIINDSDEWENDVRRRFPIRQVFSENYSRCIDIQGMLTSSGIEEAQQEMESKSNGWWKTTDVQNSAMYNKNGEYRAPNILLDKEPEVIESDVQEKQPEVVESDVQEKEAIVVDLNEPNNTEIVKPLEGDNVPSQVISNQK